MCGGTASPARLITGGAPGAGAGVSGAGMPGTVGNGSPRSQATTARRDWQPTTARPGTIAASAAFSVATTTRVHPTSAAASRAGTTPQTGRRLPSRPSSATNTHPCGASAGITPEAVRTATAIARSKLLPRLGKLAGSRSTVMVRSGQGWPLFVSSLLNMRVAAVRDGTIDGYVAGVLGAAGCGAVRGTAAAAGRLGGSSGAGGRCRGAGGRPDFPVAGSPG